MERRDSPAPKAHLRIARATEHLPEILKFYRDGLGFEVLGSFRDHAGFDGVMLGRPGAPYHLEFTQERGHPASRAPNEESLLIFYLPDEADWSLALDSMRCQGFLPVRSHNPYWDKHGRTFEDPDGYRVVLQHAAWENKSQSADSSDFSDFKTHDR